MSEPFISPEETIERLRCELERCEDALEEIANWRERCHACDEDVGQERREFADTEEWDRVRERAMERMEEMRRNVNCDGPFNGDVPADGSGYCHEHTEAKGQLERQHG